MREDHTESACSECGCSFTAERSWYGARQVKCADCRERENAHGKEIMALSRAREEITRRHRRGWPLMEVRPRCMICKARLRPTFRDKHPPMGAFTPSTHLLRWDGVANVFCSNTCAIEFARRTVADATKRNTRLIDEINAAGNRPWLEWEERDGKP